MPPPPPPLPPIFYHYFKRPLPYSHALSLQESIHQLQLQLHLKKDLLLLLQHTPVYTAGRRQTEPTIRDERTRLTALGADFVSATRGGELTYHGPGQLVGYPLINLSRYSPTIGVRDYVCRIQKTLERHLFHAHAIHAIQSDPIGVFTDPTSKIASIGIRVRHRLTSHGFAINLTRDPLPWFDQIIACGLVGVKAVSVQSITAKHIRIDDEVLGLLAQFGHLFQRELVPIDLEADDELAEAIRRMEQHAQQVPPWLTAPNIVS